MEEDQEKAVLSLAKRLRSLGIEPFALLTRTLNAEALLADYARQNGLELSQDGRAKIPPEKLPDVLRAIPEVLDAPTFVRHVMYLRLLVANPNESLSIVMTEEGVDFFYQAAFREKSRLSVPHADREGASFWTLTKKTADDAQRAKERERFEDLPLGAAPDAEVTTPAPPPVPTLEPILAVLRRLGDALIPASNYERNDQARLLDAIALDDRRRVLIKERALNETESWEALAVERSKRLGGGKSTADGLQKFVGRMFELAEKEPQRFPLAYRRGEISPELKRALDEAEKKGL